MPRKALGQIQAGSVARNVVRPVRWEVQIFGFRTMSLDLRQNTTVVNRVLVELYAKFNVGSRKSQPEPGSAEWLKWILAELKKPMPWVPQFKNLSDEARELLDLLTLVRETLDGPDPEAIGTFILSMTQHASDVLGLYLLAKYAGLFSDADAREACRLQVVPLFETIDDLRRAPDVLARTARRSLHPPLDQGAWRRAGNHARLFRLQQGWRLLLRQLRALRGAAAD